MSKSFIMRLTWDSVTQSWRILIKPVNGDPPRIFADMESAFFYVEHQFPEDFRPPRTAAQQATAHQMKHHT